MQILGAGVRFVERRNHPKVLDGLFVNERALRRVLAVLKVTS